MDDVGQFFQEQQDLYDTVVRDNNLNHREMFGALADWVHQLYTRPFRVLDLGCGDARFMALVLTGTPVAAYAGIDLVQDSLDLAARNLAGVGCPLQLRVGSFSDFPSEPVDLVVASYSLHHLSQEAKGELFARLPLLPGGAFVLIDIVLQPGQTRQQYLDHFFARIRREWTGLTERQVALVVGHVGSSDFPETEEVYRAMGERCGLDELTVLWQDPEPVAKAMVFTRRAG